MQINGITIPTPILKVGVFRIAKSERLASGKMAMEIIAIKRRLDLSWVCIMDNVIQQILNTLESRVFHTVTYPDPQKGENATITVYVGDINTEVWQKVSAREWKDVSISLIEQ